MEFGALSYASMSPWKPISLAATPRVAAAFETLERVGEGTMGSVREFGTGELEYMKTTANFLFDTAEDGTLTLGLLNFVNRSGPVGHFDFSVLSHGTELFARTFDSVGEAQAFFTDHALALGTLGAGSQDILISANYLFTGANFVQFDYVLGVEALAPVPEPGTWMMVLLGMTVLVFRARRRT
jgi:hypothetical protein